MKGFEGAANQNEAPQTTVEDLENRPWADFEGHKLAADTELKERTGFTLEAEPSAEKVEAMKETMQALAAVDPETRLPLENGNRHIVRALAEQCHADEKVLREEAADAAHEFHEAGLAAFKKEYGQELEPASDNRQPRSSEALNARAS